MSGHTEDRLLDQLDQHLAETHGSEWMLIPETFNHRILSPVEPCHMCCRKVFLLLPAKHSEPVWLQLGEIADVDTLFPRCTTKRHECGDGGSWSVEAALFVGSALAEWGIEAGTVG